MPGRVAADPTRTLGFRRWLVMIAVLALTVRLVVVATSQFTPVADSKTYDRMAATLAQTGSLPLSAIPPYRGPTAYPPPMFPIVVAAAYKIVGPGDAHLRWVAGRVLEALLGTLTVILIALLAARLFGRRTGLLAAAIASVYPPLILVGSSLMTESLFIPLTLAATLTALEHRRSRHRYRWALASGVLIGLTALTRGNGIILLIPLGFLVWTERPRFSARALRAPLALIAAVILTLTPWTIRNLEVFHRFVPITTETGFALAGTYSAQGAHNGPNPALWSPPVPQIDQALAQHPNLNEAQLSDRLQRDALHYIRQHPGYPATVVLWSVIRLFNLSGPGFETWSTPWEGYPTYLAYISVFAFWLVALVGAFGLRSGLRRAPLALWGVPLAVILSTLLFAGMTRYRSPADPFFVILAGLGITALADRFRARRVPSAAA